MKRSDRTNRTPTRPGSNETVSPTLAGTDILSIKLVSDVGISPDGSNVVFVVSDRFRDGTKHQKSNVWVAQLDDRGVALGQPRPFTRGTAADRSPSWSPDGTRIAFLSDRGAGARFQIYIKDLKSEEEFQLTNQAGEIDPTVFAAAPQPLIWSPRGDEIAFLMCDARMPEGRTAERWGGALEYEKGNRTSDLLGGERIVRRD